MSQGTVRLLPRPIRYDRGTPVELVATARVVDPAVEWRAKERRIATVRVGIRLGEGTEAAKEVLAMLGLAVIS